MRCDGVRRGSFGVLVACAALLIGSCSSTGHTARADDPANTTETTRSAGPDAAADARDVILANLDDPSQVAAWTTVNDPVMGGRSTSRVTAGDTGMVFSGTISLENNGGFASARGPLDPGIGRRATGATALRVRALGDGKTYLLKAGISGQRWSYVQRFRTEAGVPQTYDLPIGGFQPVGMRLDPDPDAPPTLDPSGIDQLSFYILDKQQGPFELTVSSIDAVP